MYKLILVDDEPRIRRGLKNSIPWGELGFEVVGEAGNGKEALALTMELRPHLVITDIKMPDMDGLEYIASLRDVGLDTLVIIISGYGEFEYARRAIRYGVTEYLLKPVEEDELYDRVLNCVRLLDGVTGVTPAAGHPPKNKNAIVNLAFQVIDAQYNKPLTLKDVAREVSVHPNYLSSLFARETGRTFSRYLSEVRIEKAKELMQNPALKIYEVAEMVGYSDYRWFSRLFKLYVGVTPGEYKK